MITPAQILNKYRSVEAYLEPIRTRVRDSLNVLCESHDGFALISRVKTLESLTEKIETGRFEDWGAIDDLVGFTVIVPTLADEPTVIAFLDEVFEQVVLRSRGGTQKSPEVFRFDGTRFIGKLRSADENARGPLHAIPFEVQVKSAFEHAWSVTTHALTYKGTDINWSKLRLTAQLKAAVEQLDTLVLAFSDAAEYITPSIWPDIQAKADLKTYFAAALSSGRIPEELTPKDWSRFIDNVYRLVASRPGRSPAGEIADVIRRDLDAELAAVGLDAVPRSISLWQLTFASLFKAGTIETSVLRKHWPLITPELEDLYPALRNFTPRFNYA